MLGTTLIFLDDVHKNIKTKCAVLLNSIKQNQTKNTNQTAKLDISQLRKQKWTHIAHNK